MRHVAIVSRFMADFMIMKARIEELECYRPGSMGGTGRCE